MSIYKGMVIFYPFSSFEATTQLIHKQKETISNAAGHLEMVHIYVLFC